METGSIEYVQPNLQSHGFHSKICDQTVLFKVLKLENSLFLWIGSAGDPVMNDLSFAMPSHNGQSPLQSKLMGDMMSVTSSSLGGRLSKKLGKPVYISYNMDFDRLTSPAVEARLMKEISEAPHYF